MLAQAIIGSAVLLFTLMVVASKVIRVSTSRRVKFHVDISIPDCSWKNRKTFNKYSLMTPRHKAFFKVMDRLGFPYSLIDGSLLGAYRNGGWIPGDNNIDIALYYAENKNFVTEHAAKPRILVKHIEQIPNNSVIPLKDMYFSFVNKILEAEEFKSISVHSMDIWSSGFHFIFSYNRIRFFDVIAGNRFPSNSGGLCRCMYSGVKVNCFENASYLLSKEYGSDFMIPNSKHGYNGVMYPM